MPQLPVEIRKAAWNMHEEGKSMQQIIQTLDEKAFQVSRQSLWKLFEKMKTDLLSNNRKKPRSQKCNI